MLSRSLEAAQDGSEGTVDSTGSMEMYLTIPDLVRLSNVGDITFSSYSGAGDLSSYDNVCIYTNDTQGHYQVTATGNHDSTGGSGTAFYVASGTYAISYSLSWNAATGGGGTAMTAGSALTGRTNGDRTSQSCGSGTALNASFQVSFSRANLLHQKRAGVYEGAITFVVEPGS